MQRTWWPEAGTIIVIGPYLVVMLMAKTYSKYGMNTYISIFPFYLRPYFDVKFTMKHSGHLWAYFSTQILSYCHKCLASNLESYFLSYKRQFKFKHKHYYGSLSHLVRYVFLVIVGLGYKLEVFSHSYKLPDNYWYVFSQHPYPMLQIHSIKNAIFRGANFGAYTDPSFPWVYAHVCLFAYKQVQFSLNYILNPSVRP